MYGIRALELCNTFAALYQLQSFASIRRGFFCKYEVVLATDIRLLTQILILLFQVYADASLVFPLLVAETFARNFKLDN